MTGKPESTEEQVMEEDESGKERATEEEGNLEGHPAVSGKLRGRVPEEVEAKEKDRA